MKKYKNYILSFIIPFIICLIVFYYKGVFSNIDSFYVSDLKVQHLPFFTYLKNVLLGNASIHYSFFAGMGSSMISTMIFYSMSPINLLLVLINDIRYAILFIYILKVSLSGLTMYILLRKKYEQDKFITVIFSVCYALSSFVTSYYFCVFWFDSLYLAPLVMLGIDKIIKNEKMNLLYILSLALAIICNIQMGFGLCIYSVVYYLYSYNCMYNIKGNFDKFKQIGIIFIISSLCAGAISSGALLGFMSTYASVHTARGLTVTNNVGVSNILYVFKNLLTISRSNVAFYNNYDPYLYSGFIVSFLAIAFLANKKIDKKKRNNAILVILFFVLSFSIGFLNLFWHLSPPMLLNFRYSIYLSLFLTSIAYERYISDDIIHKNEIVILTIALIIGLFMMISFNGKVNEIYTITFLVIIYTLIILTKNKNKKFEILLIIAVLIEAGITTCNSICIATDVTNDVKVSYDSFNYLANLNKHSNDYRITYDYSFTENCSDSLILNNGSSLRYFSSVIDGKVLSFFDKNLSTVGNNNYRLSAYDTPLILSLFGGKYFYLTEEINNYIFEKVDEYVIENKYGDKTTKKDVYLYENPYALSVGYIVENDYNRDQDMDLIDYQNNIFKAFTGINDDVTIRLDYEVNEDSEACNNSDTFDCKEYYINNTTKNPFIYVYALFENINTDNDVKTYMDDFRPFLLYALKNKVRLALQSNMDLTLNPIIASTYDKDTLTAGLKKLQENMLYDVKYDNNVMSAKINANRNGKLFLSVPYDKNFRVYVDNKQVSYYGLLDETFMGLDISEGEHEIILKYVDDKFLIYIMSSIISLIVTICLYYFINKKINNRKIIEERILQEAIEKRNARKIAKKKKKK